MTANTELFGRSWSLTVGTLELSQFDFKFRIEKSMKPEPNKALIEIYNLSAEHRAALSEQTQTKTSAKPKIGQTSTPVLGSIPVKLEAGYGASTDLIYFGDLRSVSTEFDGQDWVTSVSSADGDKKMRSSRCNISVGPKTPLDQTLLAVLKKLGLGTGNLATVVKKLQSGSVTLPRGAVLSGPTTRVLTDLCRSADLEWFVEDGQPTFVNLNKALSEQAVKLSPTTGLLGSPSVDASGKLTCQSLLIPRLRCGRIVAIDAQIVKGQYRIEKIVYEGETSGPAWYASIEGQRY